MKATQKKNISKALKNYWQSLTEEQKEERCKHIKEYHQMASAMYHLQSNIK